jgi:hypothetical protein
MKSTKERVVKLLEKLTNDGDGLTDKTLLEYILFDYMKDYEALEALKSAEDDLFESDSFYEKEYDSSSFDENEE